MSEDLSSLRHIALVGVVLSAMLAACGGEDPPPSGGVPTTGSVILGLKSELRAGVDIDHLHATMSVDEKPYLVKDLLSGSSMSPLTFPTELAFRDLPEGSAVSVDLEAFTKALPPGMPEVSRLASTKVIAGRTLLLPVTLEQKCIPTFIGGPPGGPTCTAPETCIGGVCSDSLVSPTKLTDYSPKWAQAADICKPANAGAPIVVVGEGQSDYLPLTDGEVAQVEAGPQGGHHIWIAVRMKNLRQSGSITSVTGVFPDLGVTIDPFNVIFTYDQDEGGYCKLYGLRFQLDLTQKIQTLLGHVVDVTVKVTDSDGAVGTGVKSVKLSDDFI